MSSADEEITKLYRVRRTLLHMLRDRGYLVADDEINMTKEQFVEKFGANLKRDNLFIHKEKKDNSSDQIFVFFLVPEEKNKNATLKNPIGVRPVRNCTEKMLSENVFKAIMVARDGFTPTAKKAVHEFSNTMTLELFQDSELICNVFDHALVPEHQLLTVEEKNALLQKYKVKETALPRMLVTDPVARHFGCKRGQVVKITRPSENASKYVTYRYVS